MDLAKKRISSIYFGCRTCIAVEHCGKLGFWFCSDMNSTKTVFMCLRRADARSQHSVQSTSSTGSLPFSHSGSLVTSILWAGKHGGKDAVKLIRLKKQCYHDHSSFTSYLVTYYISNYLGISSDSVMDPSEVEFLAEKEKISILTNFSENKIYLIGVGTLGCKLILLTTANSKNIGCCLY